MKKLLRLFVINLAALWLTASVLPAFTYEGGLKTLLIGVILFMIINALVIPLIKLVFLPLNILTLGIFSWLANVVGLYLLTVIIPGFKLYPYYFPGWEFHGFVVPGTQLTVFHVAIIASFLIGFIIHFLKWLIE